MLDIYLRASDTVRHHVYVHIVYTTCIKFCILLSAQYQVRKEISAVEWFPIGDLPKNTYGVEPFMKQLSRWLRKERGHSDTNSAALKEARGQFRISTTFILKELIRTCDPTHT